MKIIILSFSYKRGLPEDKTGNGGGFVFDCRGVPNPFWEEGLRKFTGKDAEVVAFFARHREAVDAFVGAAEALVRQTIQTFQTDGRRHIQVAFGCTGGQHRSVYCAEHVARHLADKFNIKVVLTHRELNTEKML